jgi:hypothetical protein
MIEMHLFREGIAALALLAFPACGGAIATQQAEPQSMDATANDGTSSNAVDAGRLLLQLPDGFDFGAGSDAAPPRNVCLPLPSSAYYGDGGEPLCQELKKQEGACENGAICGDRGTCADHCVCVEHMWCCTALAC